MIRHSTVLTVAAVLCAPLPVVAQITYTAQSRGLSVLAAPEGDGASAAGFELFQETRAVWSTWGTGATASQMSRLDPGGMFVSGGVGAYGGMQLFSASSSNEFEVFFTLNESLPFRFWGGTSLGGTQEGRSSCRVSLLGPSGSMYNLATSGNWDLSGIASPGQYRLTMTIATSAVRSPNSNGADFYGGLAVPSPSGGLIAAAMTMVASRRRR